MCTVLFNDVSVSLFIILSSSISPHPSPPYFFCAQVGRPADVGRLRGGGGGGSDDDEDVDDDDKDDDHNDDDKDHDDNEGPEEGEEAEGEGKTEGEEGEEREAEGQGGEPMRVDTDTDTDADAQAQVSPPVSAAVAAGRAGRFQVGGQPIQLPYLLGYEALQEHLDRHELAAVR